MKLSMPSGVVKPKQCGASPEDRWDFKSSISQTSWEGMCVRFVQQQSSTLEMIRQKSCSSVQYVQQRQGNQNSQLWANKFPSLSVYSALKYCFLRDIYPIHRLPRPHWPHGQGRAMTLPRLPATAGGRTCNPTRPVPVTSKAGTNVSE